MGQLTLLMEKGNAKQCRQARNLQGGKEPKATTY